MNYFSREKSGTTVIEFNRIVKFTICFSASYFISFHPCLIKSFRIRHVSSHHTFLIFKNTLHIKVLINFREYELPMLSRSI